MLDAPSLQPSAAAAGEGRWSHGVLRPSLTHTLTHAPAPVLVPGSLTVLLPSLKLSPYFSQPTLGKPHRMRQMAPPNAKDPPPRSVGLSLESPCGGQRKGWMGGQCGAAAGVAPACPQAGSLTKVPVPTQARPPPPWGGQAGEARPCQASWQSELTEPGRVLTFG